MTEQLLPRCNPEQRVHDPAVAHVHLRRTDQPLARIRGPRGQTPEEQQIDQRVEIPGDGLPADPQPRGQPRRVQQLALLVRQHLPETSDCLGRDAGPQRRKIPLQICLEKGPAPAEAGLVIAGEVGEVAVGESAAEPQSIDMCSHARAGRRDFRHGEGRQLDMDDTAGQTLSRLSQQIDRGGTEKEELPGTDTLPAAAVDDAP